jgi:pimeloyl-ACP methyl ester carboxylesterase
MTIRKARGLLAIAVAAGLLAACTGGENSDAERGRQGATVSGTASASPSAPTTPAALRPFYTQRLRWSGCGGDYECATLRAPIDYEDPGRGDVSIAMIRLPASDPDERVGSLLVNPGGPGGSGIEYVREARARFTKPVRERFDIVGFDPRGVAASDPVRCQNDQETDTWLAADASPDSPAEEQRIEDLSRTFAQRCGTRGGALLGHMSTKDAARDLDLMRATLGDEQLYYLGKSYGTFLGATYAELFPSRVGRAVLDGAIDPSLSSDEISRGQSEGFELALRAFIDDCVQRDCPLGTSRDEALRQLDQLLADSDRSPLPTDDPARPLTQSLALLGVAVPLYDRASWPVLRAALQDAVAGDGTTLLRLSDLYTDRESSGHYSTNSNDAIYAVNCLDRADDATQDEARRLAADLARTSPRFGPYIAWSNRPCVSWPARPDNAPHAIRAAGAQPILVVGTTRDPATPYQWAQGLAKQLTSGVLLSYDGDGHTAYAQGDDCVDEAVEEYLIEGTPPEDGTRCP